MSGIDLHTHSTSSDGTNTITENVALALERGLAGIAITDHDTTAGYAEAAAAAAGTDLRIVPGIEFSAEYDGASLHVLAYWVDPANPALVEELQRLTDTRFRRGELMVEKLQALGYDISFERVHAIAGDELMARPHIAQAMVEAGIVPTEKEAFDRFISDEGVAYVPKHALAPMEALRADRRRRRRVRPRASGDVEGERRGARRPDRGDGGGGHGRARGRPSRPRPGRSARTTGRSPNGSIWCPPVRRIATAPGTTTGSGAETTPVELVDELRRRAPN